MDGCKYCNCEPENENGPTLPLVNKSIQFGYDDIEIQLSGVIFSDASELYTTVFVHNGIAIHEETRIKYCPMCGRKL